MLKSIFNFILSSLTKWLCYAIGIVVSVQLFIDVYAPRGVGFLGDEDLNNFQHMLVVVLIMYAFPLAFAWQYFEALFSKRLPKLTFKAALTAAAIPLLIVGSWLTISAVETLASLLILSLCVGVTSVIAVTTNHLSSIIRQIRAING